MSCHCACLKGNEIKVIMTPGGGGSSSVSIVDAYMETENILVLTMSKGQTGTGGWAFYGSNDPTDTIQLTTPYTYNGVTCTNGPAQFIETGAMDRQHNGTQEGITTDTLIIPTGAKYFRTTKWTSNTYGAFSCIGVIE